MNKSEVNDLIYLSDKAAIPGKTFPSMSSREAPPPVETCVSLSKAPSTD